MSFDYAGLLAGNGKEEVRRAVLALDITPDVCLLYTSDAADEL